MEGKIPFVVEEKIPLAFHLFRLFLPLKKRVIFLGGCLHQFEDGPVRDHDKEEEEDIGDPRSDHGAGIVEAM